MRKPVKKNRKKTVKPAKKKVQKRNVSKRVILKKIIRKAARKILPRALSFPRPETVLAPETAAPPAPILKDDRLPEKYHEDKMVLLVRDPWWLFAYWEVTPERQRRVESQLRQAGHRDWKTVLRVYDVTETNSKKGSFFDIELNFFADNWYIDVGLPEHDWVAELGFRAVSGDFFMLLRSNVVRTPAFGISNVVDEEWMMPEDIYYQLIGLAGPGALSGSMDIRKILEKYLKRAVSSEHRPQTSPLSKK